MSGFVCSYSVSVFTPRVMAEPTEPCIEYIDNGQTVSFEQESAGKILRVLGVVASIFIPFAAPAIWGAITASGAIAAGLGTAMTGALGATLSGVIGSAAIGGLMQAGIAYASGARGGDVWRAAGLGALTGGIGGFARAGGLAALAHPTAGAPTAAGMAAPTAAPAAVSGVTPGIVAAAPAEALGATISSTIGTVTPSGIISNAIRSIIPGAKGLDLGRISAVLINAAVNNQNMGRLNGLVAQQRAELQALAARDRVVYDQRIATAQQILQDADRMDPAWWARIRMADVAGMEANEFKQAMRNIAVRQGGALDAGQRKAYTRSAALHTARSKALAYNTGYGEAFRTRGELQSRGAGLLGPNEAEFRNLTLQHEYQAGLNRAEQEAANSTAGGFGALVAGESFSPSTSPDPSVNEDTEDSFGRGRRLPFGFSLGD